MAEGGCKLSLFPHVTGGDGDMLWDIARYQNFRDPTRSVLHGCLERSGIGGESPAGRFDRNFRNTNNVLTQGSIKRPGENQRLSIAVYAPGSEWDRRIQEMVINRRVACTAWMQSETQAKSPQSIDIPPQQQQQAQSGIQNPAGENDAQSRNLSPTADGLDDLNFDPFGVNTPSQQIPTGDDVTTAQSQVNSNDPHPGLQENQWQMCNDEEFHRFLIDVTKMLE